MIPYFDAHCDTVYELTGKKTVPGALRDFSGHVSLDAFSGFAPAAQFFALFEGVEDMGFFSFDEMLAVFLREIGENNDRIVFCRTAEDLENAEKQGKLAAFLSVEGCGLLDCSVEGLKKAHGAGVRAIMPVWNRANLLSGTNAEESERGLSPEGQRFIETALGLSMLVDVSHISDRGFYDMAELAGKAGMPLIASHSNARAVCPHRRNLTDDMFLKIAATGGVAGVNLYAAFLTEKETCTLDDALRHIEHFLALGGEAHVALGCDFDGCEALPESIGGVADMGRLYERLLRANYKEDLVRDIFYNNLKNVVKRVLAP